uniref:Uncharacterized protein n=1 Tax=Anguilla anguilla TaxID=7936 RepID=A0A0E9QTH4_ANGAN
MCPLFQATILVF